MDLHLFIFIADLSPDSGLGLESDAPEKFEVYVTQVESPGVFFVQRTDAGHSILELGESLKACTDEFTVAAGEVEKRNHYACKYVADLSGNKLCDVETAGVLCNFYFNICSIDSSSNFVYSSDVKTMARGSVCGSCLNPTMDVCSSATLTTVAPTQSMCVT